jgi:hypothetical protein
MDNQKLDEILTSSLIHVMDLIWCPNFACEGACILNGRLGCTFDPADICNSYFSAGLTALPIDSAFKLS